MISFARSKPTKYPFPIRSPVSGKISKILVTDGTTVKVGQHLVDLEAGAAGAKAAASPAPSATPAATAPSPAAPKVEAPKPVAAPAAAVPKPAAAAPSAASPVISFSAERTERRVKMTRMRARIAERLKESQNTSAMLTTFNEIDMSAAMELRARFKDEFEKKHKVKLGFMSLFVKAATAALQAEPSVNAVIDGGDIVLQRLHRRQRRRCLAHGLVVPFFATHISCLWLTSSGLLRRTARRRRMDLSPLRIWPVALSPSLTVVCLAPCLARPSSTRLRAQS